MSADTTTDLQAGAPPRPVKHRRARRALALVLAVLIMLLGLSAYLLYNAVRVPVAASPNGAPVDTQGITWVRSIYGVGNRPQDLFGQTQVAVPSADGTIWVTDVNRRSSVMRFGPDGNYLGSLESANASMPITAPSRVAVGPDGRIYICETSLDRVHVLRPNGDDGGSFNIPQPVSIAVSKDRIAVGSVAGFAVLDMEGKPLGVNGTRGKGPEQFDYVHGIAFGPDGSIYVADSYNNRLSAYEPNGKRRWMIRTGAPANSAELSNDMLASKIPSDTAVDEGSALQLPLGLTVDGAGRVVVIDMYECSLAVFEPRTGKFIGKYGDVGAEDGKFFYPVSIGYDSGRDWFTVADAMNRRVQIVRIPGSGSRLGSVTSVAGRTLSGPWRACALPLLLIVLALVVYVVVRFTRRGRGGSAGSDPGPEPATDAAA